MKLIAAVTIAVGMFTASAVMAQRASAVHKAWEAARAWLDLVDSGQYGASWDQAASAFQLSVSRPAWESRIRSLRAPLGPVRARTLKWANYTETLPTLLSGQYVVLEYETRFENRASAAETVTPVQDENGTWKVSGYYLR